VNKEDSSTRRHIINATESMLQERASSEIHLVDVASRADVGLQTIYYHFASRNQLIAEAQTCAYIRLVEPLHKYLLAAERALIEQSQSMFWSALGDNVMLVLTYAQSEDQWRILKLLIDIWKDGKAQREFIEAIEIQFDRWISVIESAKVIGWIKGEIDAFALVTTFWSASIGQALFASSSKTACSSQSIWDFFVNISMSRT